MIKKIVGWAISIMIAFAGIILTETLLPFVAELSGYPLIGNGLFGTAFPNTLFIIVGAFTFCWLGLVSGPFVTNWIYNFSERMATVLSKLPTSEILVVVFGMFIGLMIANLLGSPFARLPVVGPYIPIALAFVFAVLGAKLALHKSSDLVGFINKLIGKGNKEAEDKGELMVINTEGSVGHGQQAMAKLLDTSVIIDGRVMDILASGFLEGKLLVTKFVLEELQKLADSADGLKRAKGRRGLDLVHDLQVAYKEQVMVLENDYEDLNEVDAKLVRLARELGAAVVTNDYNLNKVAGIQGVKVLNINELANAIKPLVVSGEEMTVLLMKEGREQGQAIAYLDDGTMIVVENGKRYVGKSTVIVVNSVLQTAAGRMIFAHVK